MTKQQALWAARHDWFEGATRTTTRLTFAEARREARRQIAEGYRTVGCPITGLVFLRGGAVEDRGHMGDRNDCNSSFHSILNAAGNGTIHRTVQAHRNVVAYMRSRRKADGCRLPT